MLRATSCLCLCVLRCIICSPSRGCSEVSTEIEERMTTQDDFLNSFDVERLK